MISVMTLRQTVSLSISLQLICAHALSAKITTVHGPCGSWVSLSESCYLFSDFPAPWGEAVAICKAFDANLISIDSNDENILLEGYILTKYQHDNSQADYWTGGNDIEKEGHFTWIGSHRPFAFTNWMPGQPDATPQDCVEMHASSNFKWHDDNCNHQKHFICEKRPGGSPDLTGYVIG